jgi:hypothetical protein
VSIDTVIDAMAATLLTELPELRSSELAGGQFDLKEMRRRSVATGPGAFITCTATKDGRLSGNKFACTGFFLVVIAVSSRAEGQALAQDRAHAILRLLGRAMKKIAQAGDWGEAEVTSNPEKIASMNPYGAAADSNNLALWGITWEQDLELIDDPVPAALPDLTSIHVDYSMTESAAAEDAEDDIDTDPP